jgi:hypothetical protein
MEKPSSYQPRNDEFKTDPSHLRPEGMEEGRANVRRLEGRIVPNPETIKRHRENGLNAEQKKWLDSHIAKDIRTKAASKLEHFSEEYNEDLISPEDVKEVEGFLHALGLDTKPTYAMKDEYFQDMVLGEYAPDYDQVLFNQERLLKFSGAQKLILGNIAHELAHSSSQYGVLYKDSPEIQSDHIHHHVQTRPERVGMIAYSGDEEKWDGDHEYGVALEESFADYISLLYLRKIDYSCYDFINDVDITNGFADYKNEYLKKINSSKNLEELIGNADTHEKRSKCIIEILKKIDLSKGLVYISPRSIIVLAEKENLGTSGYALLKESLELLMLDDPSLLQSFIRGRKDVQGLREVAQKLNALEPGLYVKLRNFGRSDEDQFEFYKTVVEVLSKKYLSNGQLHENNENEEITQNPH